jgi:hypothetical protein
MRQRHSVIFLAGAAVAAYLLLSSCSSSGSGSPTPTSGLATAGSQTPGATAAPESAIDALALYVQRRLSQGFVADCDKAKRPTDVGKQCARKLGERNGMIAYALGPTFSDYTQIMILKQENGVWTIADQVLRDPNQPEIPGVPWPLEIGAQVVVEGSAPDCLKIRDQPTISGAELGCLNDGTTAKIVAGPVDADNIHWWQLEGQGWAAGDYLRYAEETSVTPTAEP